MWMITILHLGQITHSKEVWDLISRNYFYPPHEKMIMSILETGGYV